MKVNYLLRALVLFILTAVFSLCVFFFGYRTLTKGIVMAAVAVLSMLYLLIFKKDKVKGLNFKNTFSLSLIPCLIIPIAVFSMRLFFPLRPLNLKLTLIALGYTVAAAVAYELFFRLASVCVLEEGGKLPICGVIVLAMQYALYDWFLIYNNHQFGAYGLLSFFFIGLFLLSVYLKTNNILLTVISNFLVLFGTNIVVGISNNKVFHFGQYTCLSAVGIILCTIFAIYNFYCYYKEK